MGAFCGNIPLAGSSSYSIDIIAVQHIVHTQEMFIKINGDLLSLKMYNALSMYT